MENHRSGVRFQRFSAVQTMFGKNIMYFPMAFGFMGVEAIGGADRWCDGGGDVIMDARCASRWLTMGIKLIQQPVRPNRPKPNDANSAVFPTRKKCVTVNSLLKYSFPTEFLCKNPNNFEVRIFKMRLFQKAVKDPSPGRKESVVSKRRY
jgi:hypothetical protein